MRKVGRCTDGTDFTRSTSMWRIYSCRGIVVPRKCGSWVAVIIRAAAAVKPLTAECEIKYMMMPIRKKPMSRYSIPTIKASKKERSIYCALPGSASGESVVRTSRLIIAMGPVDNCRKLPHKAPIHGAMIAAYNPKTGGIPASMAYAMDWGISTTATVNPASRSF